VCAKLLLRHLTDRFARYLNRQASPSPIEVCRQEEESEVSNGPLSCFGNFDDLHGHLRINPGPARDNGEFANSPLKQWFDKLASGKGLCCSFADGVTVRDVDWDSLDGHYRVRLHGQWVVVPDAALVTEPNRFGPAVVWPYEEGGKTQIRCFMPGAGT
jgi:hypothetical protein